MTKMLDIGGKSLKLCGRVGDPYFDNMGVHGDNDGFLLFVRERFISDDAVIFDVGANIGLTSAILGSKAVSGQLYAFEPGPETYPFLLETLSANGLTHCYPQPYALGAVSGELAFLANSDSGSASHLAIDGVSLGGGNIRVQVKTLDDAVSDLGIDRIDFVKIDVEGFEMDVIEGATDSLERFQPKVFVEFNSFTLLAYGNRNPRQFLHRLRDVFPYVYRFEQNNLVELKTDIDMLDMLHNNLMRDHCVNDLLCSFSPL